MTQPKPPYVPPTSRMLMLHLEQVMLTTSLNTNQPPGLHDKVKLDGEEQYSQKQEAPFGALWSDEAE